MNSNPKKWGKKAAGSTGVILFIGIILFNIIMYVIIKGAHGDPFVDDIGKYDNGGLLDVTASTDADIDYNDVVSWYDGFDITIFNLPWWINIFYVTFQAILLALAIYSLIRGL